MLGHLLEIGALFRRTGNLGRHPQGRCPDLAHDGKMFCVCCTEPVAPPKVALSFKCDDATFAELVERTGVIPAPYMAQHKWVAPEQFDTLGAAELKKLIRRAYEIVSAKLPKKKAAGK